MENISVERTVLATGNEVAAGGALENGGGGEMAASGGGGDGEFRAKRKRGRPRKEAPQELTAPARGRGRPRGSGKWQMLAASYGGSCTDTGGSNFTPYIVTVEEGENIVEKIRSFSQMTSESICILSASGSISRAEISLPGNVLRYEGQFNIVCLNGSHTYDQKKGTAKICHLSVQLAYPDGRLCGGAVAASLIAASPTQLTIATFRQTPRQQQSTNPYYLSPPNPNNNGAIATTSENGNVSDSVAIAQQSEEVVLNSTPNPIQSSSAQPGLDWKSLRPSASA